MRRRTERFDNTIFSMPVVRRFDTEDDGEFWRMWYAGRDDRFDSDVSAFSPPFMQACSHFLAVAPDICRGNQVLDLPSGRIGLCESRNGIHWKR